MVRCWTAGDWTAGDWTAGDWTAGPLARAESPPPATSRRATSRPVLAVLTVLTIVGAGSLPAQLEAGIAVGSKAPPVVINDLDGNPVDLGGVIGKRPVLLEFWATWCGLCKALLSQLERVQQAYGDRIVLFGINVTVNDSKARIRRYLDEHRPPYRVLYDDRGVGVRAYDVPSTSFIVVIDSTGRVVYTGTGEKQDLLGAVGRAFGRQSLEEVLPQRENRGAGKEMPRPGLHRPRPALHSPYLPVGNRLRTSRAEFGTLIAPD